MDTDQKLDMSLDDLEQVAEGASSSSSAHGGQDAPARYDTCEADWTSFRGPGRRDADDDWDGWAATAPTLASAAAPAAESTVAPDSDDDWGGWAAAAAAPALAAAPVPDAAPAPAAALEPAAEPAAPPTVEPAAVLDDAADAAPGGDGDEGDEGYEDFDWEEYEREPDGTPPAPLLFLLRLRGGGSNRHLWHDGEHYSAMTPTAATIDDQEAPDPLDADDLRNYYPLDADIWGEDADSADSLDSREVDELHNEQVDGNDVSTPNSHGTTATPAPIEDWRAEVEQRNYDFILFTIELMSERVRTLTRWRNNALREAGYVDAHGVTEVILDSHVESVERLEVLLQAALAELLELHQRRDRMETDESADYEAYDEYAEETEPSDDSTGTDTNTVLSEMEAPSAFGDAAHDAHNGDTHDDHAAPIDVIDAVNEEHMALVIEGEECDRLHSAGPPQEGQASL
jgi:hypothetical protein